LHDASSASSLIEQVLAGVPAEEVVEVHLRMDSDEDVRGVIEQVAHDAEQAKQALNKGSTRNAYRWLSHVVDEILTPDNLRAMKELAFHKRRSKR